MLLLADARSGLWVNGCVLNFGFLLTGMLEWEGEKSKLSTAFEYRKSNWKFQINLILNSFFLPSQIQPHLNLLFAVLLVMSQCF